MINPDLPITNSSQDILNRGAFANSLATTILKTAFPSSFTIGLYGEWGSGKTSLLNMILENIERKDDNAIILRFNPWLCTDPRQLINQFFRQLATSIQLKKPQNEKAWELIDQYADLFDAANAIPYIGFLISAAGKSLSKKAKDKVEHQSGDLQKIKNQIINKLNELNAKIIVSIDDIDRLSENEIISVFQLVKALADFPNTIYILAFDYNVVVRALSKVQQGDGKDYLEKIIQVPFEIPAPNRTSIENTLYTKLDIILSDVPEERWSITTWADLSRYGFHEYVKSIRDAIRFTNVFTIKYELLKDETDPVDLLGLTLLQVFEPSIYSKLPYYKNILCGNNLLSYESEREEKANIQKALSVIIPNDESIVDKEAAMNTLSILFPKIRTTMGVLYSLGRSYSRRDFLINHNIAVPECFDRYFALVLESDAIPTSITMELIFKSNEEVLQEGILQIYHDGKIIRFLEEIEAHVKRDNTYSFPADRAELITRVLCKNWGKFEVDDTGITSIPISWIFRRCMNQLFKAMELQVRQGCIFSLFYDEAVQPSTLAMILSELEIQHGRFTDNNSVGYDVFLPLDAVLELEKVFKSRAIQAIKSGTVMNQYQGLNFLWLLGQIDSELTTNIKSSLINDNYSLVKVINYCSSRGTSIGKVLVKKRSVSFKSLREFIDPDEAYQRITEFIGKEEFFALPMDDQISTVAYKLIYERAFQKPSTEMTISEEEIVRIIKQTQTYIKRLVNEE